MSELTRTSVSELAAGLSSGDFSAREVTDAHLERIASVEPNVHAYLHVNVEGARAVADDIDRRRAAREPLGELAGVPVAFKDLLVTTDMPTTAGSRILEGWVSPYDATPVARCRLADLVPLGKTNMDEFAMGSTTERSAYGDTLNPWDPERIPGGSSGGSAAAVAAYEAPFALGSDTGGSIRQPAHCTGIVGVKPTYGGVSRYGAIAMASSLDQIGPFGRSVLDAALLHDVIAGHDAHDSTSLRHSWPSMAHAARHGSLEGVRVGVISQLDTDGFQPGVRDRFHQSVELLSRNGAEVVEVSLPMLEYAIAAYYLLMPAEVSSNLAKFDSVRFGLRVTPQGGATVEEVMAATREVGFGPEVKRRIILGTYALSAGYYDAFYGSAQKVRTLVQRDFAAAFANVDVLVSPTAPTTAYKRGEKLDDPVAMYLGDVATIPANLAGLPGMSLPIGLAAEDNMPVGLQILAPALEDARLYQVGAALESLLHSEWGGSLISKAPSWDSTKAVK